MAISGEVALALAKKHANSLSSGIAGSSYDPTTSTMTVELNDGSTYDVVFDDGVTTADREFLDTINYDNTTGEVQINGNKVITEDMVTTEDIDFSGMF